jgi:cytochrome P450
MPLPPFRVSGMGAESEALTGRPLPSSGAVSGVLEALAFFRDPGFARQRFERLGDVFETKLLGQQLVFIRGEAAITDLLRHSEATEGWWPESVRQLLGSRSLANRNGADHRARRRDGLLVMAGGGVGQVTAS